jgi:hypothetical protein
VLARKPRFRAPFTKSIADDGWAVVAIVRRSTASPTARGAARSILPQPEPRRWRSPGYETEATAFLALALGRAGIPAEVLDVERLQLLAEGDRSMRTSSRSTHA